MRTTRSTISDLALLAGMSLTLLSCGTPTDPSIATLSGTWKFDIVEMFGGPDRPVPCHLLFTIALGEHGETPDSLSGHFPDRIDRSCPPGTYSASSITWSETGEPVWVARTGNQLWFFHYPAPISDVGRSVGGGIMRTADRVELYWPSIGATGTIERQ